jgi:Cd2+/Zn2+-exporting ATPase
MQDAVRVVWERRRKKTGAVKAGERAWQKFARIGLGAALFLTALLLELPFFADTGLYLAGYLILGGDILMRAARNIVKGRIFDENFLMSLATIVAFAIGEFPEGVAVMLFYQIGEMFQYAAVRRSRRSIAELMDIRSDYANLVLDNGDVI